jgi:hypothetical protein
LLGIRPHALVVASLAILIDIVMMIFWLNLGRLVVVTAIHGVVLAAWLFVVNAAWVREAADRYAQRLFEALDVIESGNSRP